ncbi:hypothetical protein [Dactylosporangium sp. CA-233914]|uniref:hypothetical protein n=1 Tax=Dactylosporangium sp. CA-233914 TaxID=3239934 RepID=UPI003D8A67B7
MTRSQLPWRGALLALSVAVVTAVAVLATQLLTLNTAPGGTAYAATAIDPPLKPGENPLYAIRDVLARQSAALLRGDRAAYLRTDPGAGERFDSLTALHVRQFALTPMGIPSQSGDVWKVPVEIRYCFGAEDCTPTPLLVDTEWSVERGRPKLARFEQTDRPWDGPLTVKDGTRVTVAAAPSVPPAILDRVLSAAETATRVDDKVAKSFDGPPRRYLVYVAGNQEWKRWYDENAENSAAYTIPLQPGTSDVVVDQRSADSDIRTTTLLIHEFAHVVTLGGIAPPLGAWWLYEGIAEYVSNGDGSALRTDLPSIRAYLAAGKWDGTVALGPPPAGTTVQDNLARYGLALLAVSYLAEHYGEAKMFAFFTQVVRKRATLEAASQSVFGTDWPTVSKGAAAAIRAAA